MTIHGSSFEDTQLAVDGMKINTLVGRDDTRVLPERRGRAGNHLYDRRRVGGGRDGRHAHQRHAEGRRQPVLGQLLPPGRVRKFAGGEPIGGGRNSSRLLQASTMSISSTRASGGRSNAIRSGSTCRAGTAIATGAAPARGLPDGTKVGTKPMQGNLASSRGSRGRRRRPTSSACTWIVSTTARITTTSVPRSRRKPRSRHSAAAGRRRSSGPARRRTGC